MNTTSGLSSCSFNDANFTTRFLTSLSKSTIRYDFLFQNLRIKTITKPFSSLSALDFNFKHQVQYHSTGNPFFCLANTRLKPRHNTAGATQSAEPVRPDGEVGLPSHSRYCLPVRRRM